MTLKHPSMSGSMNDSAGSAMREHDEHTLDGLREYGTIAFFVATVAIGVFTVFGDSIESLMHSLHF